MRRETQRLAERSRPERGVRAPGPARTLAIAIGALALGTALSPLGEVTRANGQTAVAAQPAGTLTVGPDANVWFTVPEANRIGRITPAGVITEFSSSRVFRHPTWITAGGDGNLWFSEGWSGERIGRITPRGAVRVFSDGLYPHGTCCGEPEVKVGPMVPGGDGNMWFTQINGIGRITPAGRIRLIEPEVHGPSIAAGPYGNIWFAEPPADYGTGRFGAVGRITPGGDVRRFTKGITSRVNTSVWDMRREAIIAGPDGNMWFMQAGGVGRITPTGAVTEFATTAPPGALAAGPDGNVWFASPGRSRVGRVTPAGAVSEFPTGAAGFTGHVDLVSGPDGNMWSTLPHGIARITPDGIVTRFSAGLSPGAAPRDLAPGPDGNIWFTDDLWPIGEDLPHRQVRIGRITPKGVITEFSPIPAIVAVDQRGIRAVQVRLRCPDGAVRACRGTLILDAPPRRGAVVRPYAVAPGGRGRIVMPLARPWPRVLERRWLQVIVTLRPRTWNEYGADHRSIWLHPRAR